MTLAENRSFSQPSRMQVVLDEFNERTYNNKLSLNHSKCQALQVCFKTNTPPHAELRFAALKLTLGVWLQHYRLQCYKNFNEISRELTKNCSFSDCSRDLAPMMMSSCLFTNAMLGPLLNMLMLFGLPQLQLHRGKPLSTCKNVHAEPF